MDAVTWCQYYFNCYPLLMAAVQSVPYESCHCFAYLGEWFQT